MREATEQLSYYDDPYSTQIFAGGNVPSEDEVSFSFTSTNSSHHSLLVVLSPTLQENDQHITVLRDSSSCSSTDEPTGMKEEGSRVRQLSANFEGNTHEHCSEDQAESMKHTPNKSEEECQEVEHLLSEDLVKNENDITEKVGDNYREQPKTPQRRERRHAVASYFLDPLQLPEQQLSESHLSGERGEDSHEGIKDNNVPPTPRQRKTYSVEDRLQNPLSMQLELGNEFTAISKGGDDDSTPVSGSHALEDSLPGDIRPRCDFDDPCGTLEPPSSPGPPSSPRLPGELRLSTPHVAARTKLMAASRCTPAGSQCVFVVAWL